MLLRAINHQIPRAAVRPSGVCDAWLGGYGLAVLFRDRLIEAVATDG
jgi:hypothetical protein